MRDTEEDRKEIELYSGCITVIPWFNGCLVWNKAVLSSTEAVLLWRDEVRPSTNPWLDEIGVQKRGNEQTVRRLNDADKFS